MVADGKHLLGALSPCAHVLRPLRPSNALMPAKLFASGGICEPVRYDFESHDMRRAVNENFSLYRKVMDLTTENLKLRQSETDLRHLRTLLESMSDRLEARLVALPLLTESECHQLLVEWSDTAAEPEGRRPVHEVFEVQADLSPQKPALVCGEESLTYQELERRANRLAHHLLSLGVTAGDRIGLCLERSVETGVGILAIFKAAGVYVPLDPGYPGDRLVFMLEDSGVSVLVTQESLEARTPWQGRAVRVDGDSAAIALQSDARPALRVRLDDLAYLIYTSGTTGRPKAVMVEHGNLAHTLATSRRRFGFGPGDRMPHLAPFSFDISLFELLNPL